MCQVTVSDSLSSLAMRRPFGTSTLLAAYDDAGPQLYLVEPSGNCQVRTAFPPNLTQLLRLA